MTIAERKAREAYDRANPWRPMSEAEADGTICELQFSDMVGSFDADSRRYFLTATGDWFQIDPPAQVYKPPMNWRPAQLKMSLERRAVVIRESQRRRA
ncbi:MULTISPECIES: hypothetical protein [unclassified Rhizobium]|uniref:hypothetical protein n=1 Tax=unclassified Rhizobium TaxID=2613769 RepID=UPI0007148972|nr:MULTISPECIES: hypothetical protein [unclassified Rhizobium]KQT03195.1 hypothetical protein ASG42_24605 [Rhizobium sp. Leaf391]KQU08410.1 hypothetical protein ASG68_22755 [Rhizobium sp. Leaf453]